MNKPNVSILINSLGQGGAERVVSVFLPELVKDFNVTLFLCYDVIDYPIPEEVDTVILLPNASFQQSAFTKLRHLIQVKKTYKKYLKTNHIDVAISFLAFSNIINGTIKKSLPNLKTIISERCYPSLMYRNNKVSWFIANNILPKYYNKNDILFSNSSEINTDLKTNFDVSIPMHVIYNPITFGDIIKTYSDAVSEKFELVNIGSIYFPKNQKLIVNALAEANNNDLRLTIYGDGPLVEELKSLIASNNLSEQITLAGRVKNVQEHLVKHDCFVLSSNTEGFPNVLLEAMSVGLACISTNCHSGPLELLNEGEELTIEKGTFAKAKYGLMVNVEDAIGLSNAILYLKAHPEECKRYGNLAYSRSKDFDLPILYKQLKSLIIK